MKINAKIVKTFKEGSVRAIAEATFDDAIAIHGIKLIDGKNGRFISMPSEKWKDAESGEYRHVDVDHPVNAETRSAMFHAVDDAYTALTQNHASEIAM